LPLSPLVGEFESGPLDIPFKRVGGSEPGVMERICRIGSARSFEPEDRLVDPRLNQIRLPDPAVPQVDTLIPRAETDGLLVE
jgi:hypothetical protein